jgi:hypothetical protein
MRPLERLLPLLFWTVASLSYGGCAAPAADAGATFTPITGAEPSPRTETDSGISGFITGTFGNMPSFTPPPTECLRVLDAEGKKLIAKGVCSGVFGAFRVPLAPGHYVIIFGAPSEREHSTELTESYRRTVEVRPGQWAVIAPPPPPNPVP